MVATLCLMNRNFDTTMSLADAISIIEDAKTYFNDVDGAVNRPELLDQFNDNFDDLGTVTSDPQRNGGWSQRIAVLKDIRTSHNQQHHKHQKQVPLLPGDPHKMFVMFEEC